MNETDSKNQDKKTTADKRFKVYNLIATTVIALAALVFSAFLFWKGETGIGGTIAGMVIAHYFSSTSRNGEAGEIKSLLETSAQNAGVPAAMAAQGTDTVKVK
jgi:hypothetical protein